MARGRIDLTRRPPTRESKKLLLIVHTSLLEARYLRSVVDRLGGYPATIRACDEGEADLDSLIELARDVSLSERRKGSGFDEVWCVVDGPLNSADPSAIERARRAGIRIATSDPSFDLWLLLHFLDISDPAKSEELKRLREKYIGGDIASLDGLHEMAMRRATALRTLYAAQGQVRNPSTDVDLLVASMYESMREFLKDNEL